MCASDDFSGTGREGRPCFSGRALSASAATDLTPTEPSLQSIAPSQHAGGARIQLVRSFADKGSHLAR